MPLVSYIKVEVVAARSAAFKNYRARYNISRSKLKAFVISVHKAFFVTVEQVCTLSSYRLAYQELLPVVSVKSGGMKLNVA